MGYVKIVVAKDLTKEALDGYFKAISANNKKGAVMQLTKLVIVKGKTKKECEDYFKMISANEDVKLVDIKWEPTKLEGVTW